MDYLENLMGLLQEYGLKVGLTVLGAVAIWIFGRMLISLATKLVDRVLSARSIDETLRRYVSGALRTMLNIVLIVGILGFFGIETTAFAAVLAAAGVAIGMAWSGLLANFAAGAFMVVLRPIRVGDYVTVGGVEGTVNEVGLFVSKITSVDNVMHIVGNNKIFSENIINYSTNPFRRVDLKAQLAHDADVERVQDALRAAVAQIPNVASTPSPDVEILEFNLAGTVLCVRPYCHTQHYWQVYFETNRVIREQTTALKCPVPNQHYHVQGGVAQLRTAAA